MYDAKMGRWWPSTARRCDGSHDRNSGKLAIHLVSTWASAKTLTLGQVKTEEKSNKITPLPQLLQMLELYGRIVTIDAWGQKEIAQGIVDRGLTTCWYYRRARVNCLRTYRTCSRERRSSGLRGRSTTTPSP